jgi:hypothetical protein
MSHILGISRSFEEGSFFSTISMKGFFDVRLWGRRGCSEMAAGRERREGGDLFRSSGRLLFCGQESRPHPLNCSLWWNEVEIKPFDTILSYKLSVVAPYFTIWEESKARLVYTPIAARKCDTMISYSPAPTIPNCGSD